MRKVNAKGDIFNIFECHCDISVMKHMSLKEFIFGACRPMLEFIVRYFFFWDRKFFEQHILRFEIQWQGLKEVNRLI